MQFDHPIYAKNPENHARIAGDTADDQNCLERYDRSQPETSFAENAQNRAQNTTANDPNDPNDHLHTLQEEDPEAQTTSYEGAEVGAAIRQTMQGLIETKEKQRNQSVVSQGEDC